MTEPDEETKEQPAYPEPTPPAEPTSPTTTIGSAPPAPTYPQPPPAPGWPGQPPPMQGYPGQPPGYGPPGYGPPGYGAPPGYGPPGYAPGWAPAQSWAAAPVYRTSPLAALAGVLLVLFGALVAVLGGWTLTQGAQLSDLLSQLRRVDLLVFQPTRDQLRTAFSLLPVTLMVFGLLQLLVGAVVLAHRGWARWLGVLLALLGLLLGVVAVLFALALLPSGSVQMIVAAVLLIGYAIVMLALISGGSHFRARSPGR